MPRLYGREKGLPLAGEVIKLRPGAPAGESPMLIFVGPSGAGKTALLDAVEDILEERVPHARMDGTTLKDSPVPDVLAALGFELNRRCGRLDGLRFPRLLVGRMVMDEPLIGAAVGIGADPEKARQEVRRILDRYRDRAALRNFLSRLAGAVVPPLAARAAGVMVDAVWADVIGRVLSDLMSNGLPFPRFGRRSELDKGERWYGAGTAGPDKLVKLNVRYHEYPKYRGWVDRLLLDAFLADLEDEFANGPAADGGYKCAILVDDAEGAAAFVKALLSASAGRTRTPPIGVIAAARGGPAVRALAGGAAAASLAEIDVPAVFGDPAVRRLRIALPDLTWNETEQLARHAGFHDHTAKMIHQFTAGNPHATARLVRAAAECADERADVGTLLGRPYDPADDADPERPIGERLVDDFLSAFSPRQREHLITTAAARDQDEAQFLTAALLSPADAGFVLRSDVWQPARGAGPETLPAVLHRLLARRLAERVANGTTWDALHARLRPAVPGDGLTGEEQVRDLYHALALGDLAHVTRRLAALLTEMPASAWLGLVAKVTAAPRRTPAVHDPSGEAERLARTARADDVPGLGHPRALAALVAGLWIAADPFTGPARYELHTAIAAAYDLIAQDAHSESAMLNGEAEDHREIAKQWPR
ncbi:ATP-binding cassette domain-containing protein [Actinomadura violacea]|uniref:ATP-binding protein n=1 Tax=Actinomadura violacea TaxID=2819934 RepID=A0ABS3RIE4_9ACTN|nr:ABC transporter ATP-binding protein [Actinomadura violacea]MBO2456509.1 hypothetical protein [Actinomadura violacea]